MTHLTLEQRYKIEAYKNLGRSLSEIGDYIGKDKSVVSRELKRNSDGRNGVYKADLAQKKTTLGHKEKPKYKRLNKSVKATILSLLNKDYSPEQIVGRCKIEKIEMVSVECIYQFIWKDKKQGGKLYKHLRNKGKKYRKRGSNKDSRGLISNRLDIDERPGIVDKKERIGDLEIDLIIGKNHNGALLTINDRATGILLMGKVESKQAHAIEAKTIELLKDYKPLLHTITSDNGKEFANHQNIANALQIAYYFAKPYHSWERGANENLNGLVRQYFPKISNFDLITQQQIDRVVNILNNRPRKRFGFKSPNEVFADKLDKIATVAFIT
ncbi:IS30 family transposase [Myroides odoratimimus]|uniref:IS30 family transposase n=1 Tax=Myroides odoratimimus TaxID=76832 RepID=UPI00031A0C35|nr:IS30 family transposase [Myroides odoratimimus]MCS7474616.1 IS30 family transposase [Myroides odoratimimus]MDM1060371.1 IS30 family transposase [Myroides odoratimimus]MDM1067010.1 IS30 family transposase [Myroides odoratimimus]MDM1521629.1 IS30 family transposase [Myroides odoratimimus]MDX4975656.1 IS30 family transposase [Myroides odoratimimus]